jgi:hypothetical protein
MEVPDNVMLLLTSTLVPEDSIATAMNVKTLPATLT